MGTTEWSWWARGEYEAHPPGSSGSASGRTSHGGSPTSVLQSRQSLLDIETGDTEEGFEAVETAVQPTDPLSRTPLLFRLGAVTGVDQHVGVNETKTFPRERLNLLAGEISRGGGSI